eukprot:scaffold1882_cov181-Skeletonema_marinoi.AAC.15
MPNKVEEAELIKAVTAKSTFRSSSSRSKTRITESSHDTNNQETDVDEADNEVRWQARLRCIR